jgi:hypothetical protein
VRLRLPTSLVRVQSHGVVYMHEGCAVLLLYLHTKSLHLAAKPSLPNQGTAAQDLAAKLTVNSIVQATEANTCACADVLAGVGKISEKVEAVRLPTLGGIEEEALWGEAAQSPAEVPRLQLASVREGQTGLPAALAASAVPAQQQQQQQQQQPQQAGRQQAATFQRDSDDSLRRSVQCADSNMHGHNNRLPRTQCTFVVRRGGSCSSRKVCGTLLTRRTAICSWNQGDETSAAQPGGLHPVSTGKSSFTFAQAPLRT